MRERNLSYTKKELSPFWTDGHDEVPTSPGRKISLSGALASTDKLIAKNTAPRRAFLPIGEKTLVREKNLPVLLTNW